MWAVIQHVSYTKHLAAERQLISDAVGG